MFRQNENRFTRSEGSDCVSRDLRNGRAMHAKHRRAVEALWSEQESRVATYRIANASIQDSRDEVHQIANVLPQMEASEWLEPNVTNGVFSHEGTGGETSS